jgi:outer membrane protein OmpA-like peptidoglycan-associated protein
MGSPEMNLNYDKIKNKYEHGGNQWTSYSDLFLVLSVVFLLLYVVANLRSGTASIASGAALQSAKQEVEDLKKQVKAYEVLREDYLKQGATGDEVKVYQDLMDHLSLLENESKTQHDELYKQAKEAEEKEHQLNHYQALVKNIISANLVAQSKIKKRDQTIDDKDKDIGDLSRVVQEKETEIRTKQDEIAKNNQTIEQIDSQLKKQIHEVQYAYRSKKNSKAKLESEIAKLESESQGKIHSLKQANSQYVNQLQSAQAEIEEKNRKAEKLLASLNQTEAQYQQTIAALNQAHDESMKRAQEAYEEGLRKGTLSADEKVRQEQAHRAEVEAKNQAYNAKLQALQGQLAETEGNIHNIEGKYQSSIAALQRNNGDLQRDLNASIQKLNEQRTLAEEMKKALGKKGIPADVDLKTGDVVIKFENEYFDSGSAELKAGMKATLQKLMPVYAKTLFQNPKIAKRISSVEIVGFASPTYKGKYVDPDSLSSEDRVAVNYNMDLSYQRAKSIFETAFDTNQMSFENQKLLLPLVKVSGRSYLSSDNRGGRNLSSMEDLKKSQRVIIKFNLRDE